MRASPPELDGLLRRALADHLSDDAPTTTYSMRLSDDRVHFLYWGGCTAVRTRDPRRLFAGLLAHLGGHTPPAEGVVRVTALALVCQDRAVLAPAAWRAALAQHEPGLHRAEIAVHDGPWVDLDLRALELVVPERPVANGTPLEGAARLAPASTRGPEPTVDPGRYRLAGWLLPPSELLEAAPSLAATTMWLTGALGQTRGSAAAPTIAELARIATAIELRPAERDDLAGEVTGILSRGGAVSATTERT